MTLAIPTTIADPPRSAVSPAIAARRGSARLAFAATHDGGTYLIDQYSTHPYHLCRVLRLPQHPPGMAHLYLMSSAGGLFAGDDLHHRIEVRPGARAHVSTQASTIVHAGDPGPAVQATHLRVEADATLEYWPDPTILMRHAALDSRTTVICDDRAGLLLLEAILTHDPRLSADHPGSSPSDGTQARLETSIESTDGSVIARERLSINQFSLDRLAASCGWRSAVVASAVWLPPPDRVGPAHALAAWRDVMPCKDGLIGVSSLRHNRGVSARIIAADGVALRDLTHALWCRAREAQGDPIPAAPRK
ncbi:MAG: urease accessory protein UreD [Planctomycetota bacterium]